MSSRAIPRVVVLKGGISLEKEISLLSGTCCAAALRETNKYEVVELVADQSVANQLEILSPDVVFNSLHGRWGEDGCIQGILEWLKIPYTHSGVLSSSVCMNKEKTKSVYGSASLPCPLSISNPKESILSKKLLKNTYVIKPINEGSSLGVQIVTKGSNSAFLFDKCILDNIMVEEFIPGRDLTVTVLGSGKSSKALTVTDIVTQGWYDYDAKYSAKGSVHILPAKIPTQINEICLKYAEEAHRELGCRGISRTDFRWDDTRGENGIYLLETNNQPGMTSTSLSPEQALHCNISLSELCSRLVEDASCNR